MINLNLHKSVSGSIPTKVVKMVADTIATLIAQCINVALISANFPQPLKLAEIISIFIKGDKFLKENYRPISILPSLSKVFERVINI